MTSERTLHTRLEDTRPTTLRPMKLPRLGTRRLARAHVTLKERPRAARLGRQALDAVCEALGRELGCSVHATGRLLEAVVMPATGLAHSAAFALVGLVATGGTAVLELEPPVLFAALERLAGAGAKPGPVMELTRLEEATFAYLVLSMLCALRQQEDLQRLFSPHLTGVTMSRTEALARLDARQRHVAVELTVTVGRTTAGGRLVLPAVVLEGALKAWPVERELELAPEVLEARLVARCFVGRTSLPREALETLGVGDVVLFEGLRRDEARLFGSGRLALRGFELVGDFAPEGFSLYRARGRALPKESDMVDVNERSEGMPPLPVDVEIELTRLMVPLSELAVLKPGALLPLHINASEPVVLRVGDRAVARAELVDIEGEVGARILTLLP
jgi:type III secretion protein Q